MRLRQAVRFVSAGFAGLLTLFFFLSSAHSGFKFGSAGGTGPGEALSVSCGSVVGTVGPLVETTTEQTGNGWTRSAGTAGVKWNGEQYEHADLASPATKQCYDFHWYSPDPEFGSTLEIDYSATSSASGYANRKVSSDPSWWWNSNSEVKAEVYSVRVFADYQHVTLTVTYDPSQMGSVTGGDAGAAAPHVVPPSPATTNNNENTAPPSSTSSTSSNTSAQYIGVVTVPTYESTGALTVCCIVTCKAKSACVDNAKVTNDQVKSSWILRTRTVQN